MLRRVLTIVCVLGLASASVAVAADWEGEVDGPILNVEAIDLEPYGVPAYLDYLGKGYVPMLETLEAEELILDYGVMVKQTGALGSGDVVIWWSAEDLAAVQEATDRMEELSTEMRGPEEWRAMYDEIRTVRKPASREMYTAVTWSEAAED